MRLVLGAEAFRDQPVDGLADQRLGGIAEDQFSAVIARRDAQVVVDGEQRLGRQPHEAGHVLMQRIRARGRIARGIGQ